MTLEDKIVLFSKLGDFLLAKGSETEIREWAYRARNENGWFTEDNVLLAIRNISASYLDNYDLNSFTSELPKVSTKTVGIVCAGNIPLVGFHDLLCVLLSGHKALLKLSSSDSILMKKVISKILEIAPEIEGQIEIAERLNKADAYIATGSDNSARYFDYYFKGKPNIIRKNRSSVSVLTGMESGLDLRNLGNDIFQYFGLGCRNVSKLFVPKGYKFDTLFESIEYWNTISIHHKYLNNYDYNKSIYLINREKHFDNGFLLIKPDENLISPLAVLFYEEYEDELDLNKRMKKHEAKLQCIVGTNYIPFGQSQTPKLNEFADGVDTLSFLSQL